MSPYKLGIIVFVDLDKGRKPVGPTPETYFNKSNFGAFQEKTSSIETLKLFDIFDITGYLLMLFLK